MLGTTPLQLVMVERVAVTLGVLGCFLCPCLGMVSKMLPVYDIRTGERFAFPRSFLRLVLEAQTKDGDLSLEEYASQPMDSEGYIINEEGHLVPFEVYKKGLHARNCRGGFHKRKTEQIHRKPRMSDQLYELQVYKRQSIAEPPGETPVDAPAPQNALLEAYPAPDTWQPPASYDSDAYNSLQADRPDIFTLLAGRAR